VSGDVGPHAAQLEQRVHLPRFGGGSDHQAQPLRAQAQDQLARTGQRPQPGQMFAQEQLRAHLIDRFARRGLLVDADGLGEQLVASLADQRPQLLEGDFPAVTGQGLLPGSRVRVIAVDQRAVDIEKYRANL
jgi:hypothetical protein